MKPPFIKKKPERQKATHQQVDEVDKSTGRTLDFLPHTPKTTQAMLDADRARARSTTSSSRSRAVAGSTRALDVPDR